MSDHRDIDDQGGSSPSPRRLGAIELMVAATATMLALVCVAILSTLGVAPLLSLGVAAVALGLAGHAGAFKVAVSMGDWQVVPTVAISSIAGLISVAFVEALVLAPVHSIASYAVAAVASVVSLSGGILLGRHLVRCLWCAGRIRTTAIVVGNEFTTHELDLEISEHESLGIDVIGSVELHDDAWSTSHHLARAVTDLRPDRVIIAGSSAAGDFELATTISGSSARVYVLPELVAETSGQRCFAPHQLNGFPLLRVDRVARQASDGLVSIGANPVRQF